jgi:hypothetical protein
MQCESDHDKTDMPIGICHFVGCYTPPDRHYKKSVLSGFVGLSGFGKAKRRCECETGE